MSHSNSEESPALRRGESSMVLNLPRKLFAALLSSPACLQQAGRARDQLFLANVSSRSTLPGITPNLHVQIITRSQVADAQLGKVARIALIYLFQPKISFGPLTVARRHVFRSA